MDFFNSGQGQEVLGHVGADSPQSIFQGFLVFHERAFQLLDAEGRDISLGQEGSNMGVWVRVYLDVCLFQNLCPDASILW